MKRPAPRHQRAEERPAFTRSLLEAGRIAVFAPSPLVTIVIEPGADHPEVHLHAGGQGFWVARLAATLGADVVLCCALGGEPGRVLRALIETEPLTLRAATAPTANGVDIYDRRSGTRVEVVRVESEPLARHASDELYGIALGAGLDADLTLITGSEPENIVEADLYRRLAGDLRANGKLAIADLTGSPLRAVLEGGIELLKLSDEELVQDGYAASDALSDLVEGARRLHAAGARHVLVSRAAEPALLIGGGGDCRAPACRSGVRAARAPRHRRFDVRRYRRRPRPRHGRARRGAPRRGGGRTERHTARLRDRHAAGDRASRRPRHHPPHLGGHRQRRHPSRLSEPGRAARRRRTASSALISPPRTPVVHDKVKEIHLGGSIGRL